MVMLEPVRALGAQHALDIEHNQVSSCCEEDVAKPDVTKGPRWHLVWCHERCCKPENQQLRDAISETARLLGGALICFKKARSYDAWRVRRARCTPFVLLTDWREVKPCMAAMGEGLSARRPSLTVLHCEQPRAVERANSWVRGLLAKGIHDTVYVVHDTVSLSTVLAKAIMRLSASAALSDDYGQGVGVVAGACPSKDASWTVKFADSTPSSMCLQYSLANVQSF